MYESIPNELRTMEAGSKRMEPYKRGLLHRAAKAIEELRKQIEELELHYCRHAIHNEHDRGDDSLCEKYKCEVTALPRWIPVTERLPECDLGAEVGNIEWISDGMVHAGCFGRGGKYRDTYFRTWTDVGEGMDAKYADCWRAVTIPQPSKEEKK